MTSGLMVVSPTCKYQRKLIVSISQQSSIGLNRLSPYLYGYWYMVFFRAIVIDFTLKNTICCTFLQFWNWQRHRCSGSGYSSWLRWQPTRSASRPPGLLLLDIPWGSTHRHDLHRWWERIPAICKLTKA